MVGCGQMGHGIVQVTAQSGYEVVVREVSGEALEKGLANTDKLAPADAASAAGRRVARAQVGPRLL